MRLLELSLLVLITMIALSSSLSVHALKLCPDCGHTKVPYPFSTAPNCGDQSYKIRCTPGTLWFDTINGSSYTITSINPTLQRFIVQPPGFANNTCMSSDFPKQGMLLDKNSLFNISSTNSVVLMNFSQEVLTLLWNCSSSSICNKYLKDNVIASKACGVTSHDSQICCDIKTGGSATAYRIRVRKERCAAYVNFPNLDSSLPVSMWKPGVEIEWESPEEPPCKVPKDCLDSANSDYLPDPVAGGARKCFCKSGFHWDMIL